MKKDLKETKKRTSKYDKNRSCYMREDGSYVYEIVDIDTGATIKETFVPDDDTSAELVIWLDDNDHQEDLNHRYDEENIDWEMENKRNRFEKGTTEEEFNEDPFLQIQSSKNNTETILFEEKKREDPRLEQLRKFMAELSDDQVNLIYDFFSGMKSLREIAEETVKTDGSHPTEQAIYNRKQKVVNRLKKMFEKEGLL